MRRRRTRRSFRTRSCSACSPTVRTSSSARRTTGSARLVLLYSTVPAPVVTRDALERMVPGSVVIDLAAPPGGVDLDAARDLGLRGIWARGLGRRAPVTVGASQWRGIRRRIEAIKEEQ